MLRQRDPAEREALEELHDGYPDRYVELKRKQCALQIHEREHDAVDAILADWNQARREHGLAEAVMIARDNATRELLNDRARELLVHDRTLAADGVTIAEQEFRVGERVIARRNDRAAASARSPFVAPPEPDWRGIRRVRERGYERGYGREL